MNFISYAFYCLKANFLNFTNHVFLALCLYIYMCNIVKHPFTFIFFYKSVRDEKN